jgi:transposase-like protein
MAANETPKTLQQAILHFSDLDTCQQALAEARWPDGVECPHCGSREVSYLSNQRRWQCKTKHPKRQFSVKVGTIFEDSPIGLDKWFVAIWLISSAKNGISSYELHRAIDVTQKTAWFMLQRIRLAMQTKSFNKFGGEVEADETFIGGKARNMHATKRRKLGISQSRSMIGKTAVMGLLARHGENGSQVRLEVIQNRKKHQLEQTISENVEPGTALYTDALRSYDRMEQRGYVHKVIDHAEAYVDGQVHTNGLENFWSLLKRAIKGTYVSVEPFRYLDEQTFRFNSRKMSDGARFTEMLARLAGKRLTYANLIGNEEQPLATA